MKKFLIALILVFSFTEYSAISQDFSKSIVKIYGNYNPWDYESPWQKVGIYPGVGTGCVIQGKKIITNAHLVANAVFIEVQFSGESKKYMAKPLFINNIADLALLEVENQNFLESTVPLDLGELPEVLDDISVYGFPIGGEQMSITKGVVSRIEFGTYAQSYISLLHGQIDAAVNPGNSGGPVMKNGKCIGIIMQTNTNAENTSYFVPTPVINHFLEDVKDGKLDGIPNDLIYIQQMQNEFLRKYYGMSDEQTGVRITKIIPDSPCKDLLFENDLILAIDGKEIDNNNMFVFRNNERMDVNYLLYTKQVGETINYKVLRNGKILTVPVKLTKKIGDGSLVPLYEYDKQPTYFIIAGILFQPLTFNLMSIYQLTPRISKYFYDNSDENIKEIVLLTKILPNRLTSGYEYLSVSVVKKVNGIKITDMKTLIKAFEKNTNKYHIIDLEDNYQIILERDKIIELNNLILEMYGITSDRSNDLK